MVSTSNKSVPEIEMAVDLQWPCCEVATMFTEAVGKSWMLP